jgi:hypothetical protein
MSSLALAAQSPSPAQVPAGAPASSSPLDASAATVPGFATFSSDANFTVSYPSDWEVLDSSAMMPAVRLKMEEKAQGEIAKKAADCTQIALLLRHGIPQSRIVVIVVPYSCIGPALNSGDLAGAVEGISTEIKTNNDLTGAMYSAYKIGKHDLWIEKADASPKVHPETKFKMEIVCVMLKKAMVTWMTFAQSEDDLTVAESLKVSLDGDNPAVLVPPGTLTAKKP